MRSDFFISSVVGVVIYQDWGLACWLRQKLFSLADKFSCPSYKESPLIKAVVFLTGSQTVPCYFPYLSLLCSSAYFNTLTHNTFQWSLQLIMFTSFYPLPEREMAFDNVPIDIKSSCCASPPLHCPQTRPICNLKTSLLCVESPSLSYLAAASAGSTSCAPR